MVCGLTHELTLSTFNLEDVLLDFLVPSLNINVPLGHMAGHIVEIFPWQIPLSNSHLPKDIITSSVPKKFLGRLRFCTPNPNLKSFILK